MGMPIQKSVYTVSYKKLEKFLEMSYKGQGQNRTEDFEIELSYLLSFICPEVLRNLQENFQRQQVLAYRQGLNDGRRGK